MPEQGQGNGGENRASRNSKTLALWALIVLMSIIALQFMGGQDEAASEFTYSEFLEQLEQNNIMDATVVGARVVEGEFRNSVLRDDGQEHHSFTTTLPGDITESLLQDLRDAGVAIDAEEERTGWGTLLFSALPWILIIAFWIWIFRTMQGGGNRAFQFGRSKAKLISPDTPKVTFTDVAGADEAKEELQEIIEFLKDPQKFARLGGRLPKGVLLVGPPGTGKTLMAKAVAGKAGRPFFQMSGSDFVEMFVGVGASRVRDLFEQGKAHAPCIIFIDEIDAVGRHRGAGLGGGHDEREQTLNALLVEMDGFESNEGVILLAATNRPDVLDPALLRPGRFDRQVVVDFPDVKGRESILRVHAKKLPLADDVELGVVARGTPGLSGADLANICNESALLAARRNADRVWMDDFEQAKDKVMLGTERKSLVLTEKERKLTSYHEAGHTVIGLRYPGMDPVHKVTIVPRGRAMGITASLPTEDRHSYTKEFLEGQLTMLFGGRVAEEMVFGKEKITTGAGNDIQRATGIARRMVTQFGMSDVIGLMAVGDADQEIFLGRELVQRREVSDHTAQQVDQEVKRTLDQAHRRARTVIEEHHDLLEEIALALLERETLGREEIEALDKGEPLPEIEGLPEMIEDEPPGAWGQLKAGARKVAVGSDGQAENEGPGEEDAADGFTTPSEVEEEHEEEESQTGVTRLGVEPEAAEGDVFG